jgi:hypothetical protein
MWGGSSVVRVASKPECDIVALEAEQSDTEPSRNYEDGKSALLRLQGT